MITLAERTIALREQVARMVRDHKALRQRATDQEAKIRDQDRSLEMLKARVAELERENEVLRKVKAGAEPAASGTKEKIDELVNEIDRCLALLHA
jgi:soluble cytochrome b562